MRIKGLITSVLLLICGIAHAQILQGVMNVQAASGGAPTAPGYVQAQNCTTGSTSCSISITATGGNSILVAVGQYSTITSWTVSDTHNTYNAINTLYSVASCCGTQMFLATNITGGALSITCTPNTGVTTTTCIAIEMTPGTAISVDQLATGTGTLTSAWTTSATATTTQANELLISCGGKPGSNVTSITAGGSWTIPANANLAASGFFCEYQSVSATGAYSGSATAGAADTYAMQIATLK
jgi:hypothetical protein